MQSSSYQNRLFATTLVSWMSARDAKEASNLSLRASVAGLQLTAAKLTNYTKSAFRAPVPSPK